MYSRPNRAAFLCAQLVVYLAKTSYDYLIERGVIRMDRSEYVERLMKIGMLKCCAERTVDAFLDRDEYAGLENYISTKECVAEVLG